MATLSQNQSASLDANYNQEFVDWTTAKYGHDAEGILTNVNSARTAATEFVEERLKPEIMSNYGNAQALTSSAPLRPSETLPSELPNVTGGRAGDYEPLPANVSGNNRPLSEVSPERSDGGYDVSAGNGEPSRMREVAQGRSDGGPGVTAGAVEPSRVREDAPERNRGGQVSPAGAGEPLHVRDGGGRALGQDVPSDFAAAKARVAQQSEGTGIKNDIGNRVAAQRSENADNIRENGAKTGENKTTVQASSDILKGEHHGAVRSHDIGRTEEDLKQTKPIFDRSETNSYRDKLEKLRNQK